MTSGTTTTAPAAPRSGFRTELQGLRALAVGLVLVFHLWPNRVSGGFVGVDVFFVISGFLITSHLVKQLATTGTINLAKFWARRVMRLLPMAFLVVLVSAVALFTLMPETSWQLNARHMIGSVFYVENWLLSHDAVQYSAQDDNEPMMQHYWSLSVEEQFYVFLPLVLLLAAWVFGKKLRNQTLSVPRLVGWTLAVVGTASLVYSIWYTNFDPSSAYFITPTRLWEFAIGGLIAVLPARRTSMNPLSLNVISWLGLGMIVVAGFVYSGSTAFPGYAAALPAIGAALFIRYGTLDTRFSAYRVFGWRPMVKIGDWSYAIYLWHWPIIVVCRTIMEDFLWPHKLIVIVASILLGWGSQKLIEDPMRFAQVFKQPRMAFGFMAAGMAVTAGSVAATNHLTYENLPSEEVVAEDHCVGANAMFNDCEDATTAPPLVAPALVAEQAKEHPYPGCDANVGTDGDMTNPESCHLGAESAHSTVDAEDTGPSTEPAANSSREDPLNVMILGDSHARAWLPLFDQLGQDHNWAVSALIKPACTVADRGPRDEEGTADEILDARCANFSHAATQMIEDDDDIDVVFMAVSPRDETFSNDTAEDSELLLDSEEKLDEAYHAMWQRFEDSGKKVVVMGEVLRFDDNPIPECVALADDEEADDECAMPRELLEDARRANLTEAAKTYDGKIPVFDPRPGVCDDEACYAVVGGLVAYSDTSHFSEEFAASYQPAFERFLTKARLLD